MKRGEIKIPKGKVLQVNIKGDKIEDERLFTNARKLIKFLNLIERSYSPVKIKFKQRNLN